MIFVYHMPLRSRLKYNFTIISMTFVRAQKSEHMKQKRIKTSNFSSQNATLATGSSELFN